MPETEPFKNLSGRLNYLLETSVLRSKLDQHLHGAFQGAELRSMSVGDVIMKDSGASEQEQLKLKLGILCTDLGKTGGLSADPAVNRLVEAVYTIKDHGFNPAETSLETLLKAHRQELESSLGEAEPFDSVVAKFYQHYNFNPGDKLRTFYNQHVYDSLEILDAAWVEAMTIHPELTQDQDCQKDFATVRKAVALHHAYRGVIPTGYSSQDIDVGCLTVMATDIYDAARSRPPIEGIDNSHEATMGMLQRNLGILLKFPELAPKADIMGQSIEVLAAQMEKHRSELEKIYQPPVEVPENATLEDFAGEQRSA